MGEFSPLKSSQNPFFYLYDASRWGKTAKSVQAKIALKPQEITKSFACSLRAKSVGQS